VKTAWLPRPRRIGFIILSVLCLSAFVLPAFSQSCALCYTQAASSGSRMIQALKSGILILVIPPTLGSVGMIFLLRRKNNQVRSDDDNGDSRQDW